MFAVQYLKLMLDARLERARDAERGASAVEWVIITAVLVGIAVTLGVLITTQVKNKSSEINFGS